MRSTSALRTQRQIDAVDQQLDNLIYDLCSLTEAEIAPIEAAWN